jgi:RNA polymerase sigma-70 factor (sigma-E family)
MKLMDGSRAEVGVDRELELEFEEFVAGSYARLLRTAYLMCGDRGVAEDAVQVTLAKVAIAWRRIRQFDDHDHYIARILVNTVNSTRRRFWLRERPTENIPEQETANPFEAVDSRDALRRSLATLPQRQRVAVVLRYYEDLSEREAADVMNCTVGTVKTLTFRGLRKLRNEMQKSSARSNALIGGERR